MTPRSSQSTPVTIGRRVHERRRALGLTQEQLAAKAGTALRTVQRTENDQHRPDLTTLDALAAALEVSVSYLIDGTDQPAEPEAVAG